MDMIRKTGRSIPSRQISIGKYRNLSQVKRPLQAIQIGDEDGPSWRMRGEYSILDYCTYHVLIAFIVLLVVAATVTLAVLLTPSQKIVRDEPNILVIVADDLGYNDLGYNGNGDIRTPYIDRLAEISVKLSRHYTSAMCSPTRAALLTGRYPFRYGMSGNRALYYGSKHGLSLQETLLPQKLKEANYKTYMIGKWHLGFSDWAMTPVRRGFDYFYGMYGGSATYETHMSYEGPRSSGYDLFEDVYTLGTGLNHKVVKDPKKTFSELLYTEKAIQKIEESVNDDTGNPFFMVVSYSNPHAPIEPMAQDLEQNSDIQNEKRRGMAAMINSLDYGVGRITAALENTLQLNKTVIVFLSDNGGHLMMPSGESLGSSNLPFRGAKGTLYEGGVRTPAFIHIPHLNADLQKGDLVYNKPFHVTDWFATIAQLARLDLSKEKLPLDGIGHTETFRKVLEGNLPTSSPRDYLILDIDPVYDQAGIIKGDFKLLVGNPAPYQFDEVYPLISEESENGYPEIVLNSTHYKLNSDIMTEVRKHAERQKNYASDPDHCLALDCMSANMVLYDLSVDITESYDISWRFTHIKQAMYEALKSHANSTHPLTEPLFFEDENSEALTGSRVWTPWLNSTVS